MTLNPAGPETSPLLSIKDKWRTQGDTGIAVADHNCHLLPPKLYNYYRYRTRVTVPGQHEWQRM